MSPGGEKNVGPRGIPRRVALLVIVGTLAPMALFAWAARSSLGQLARQNREERLSIAKSLASSLDDVLRENFSALAAVPAALRFDLEDDDAAPEHAALQTASLRARHLDGVFLLRERDLALWQQPPGRLGPGALDDLPGLDEALHTGRPLAATLVRGDKARLFFLVPVTDWQGRTVGVAGGFVDPAGPGWSQLLRVNPLGGRGSADLVDGAGLVLTSSDPSRMLKKDAGLAESHLLGREPALGVVGGGGRPAEAAAFAPLGSAPWGVVLRQPESEAFAALFSLRRTLALIGLLVMTLALAFAWGTARSLTQPLAVLSAAAERIASGELSRPIPPLGEDEVGRLGRSLEAMRLGLRRSMDEVTQVNLGLEARVQERTRELERLYEELRQRDLRRSLLLGKVISAQEEERKRIARELHDETCQNLSALAMGLQAATAASPAEALRARVGELQSLAGLTLDGVHRLIFDLRPSVLDDLGFLAAVRWFAERQLAPLGISVRCESEGVEERLPPEMETALFRVVQEALVNVARHAGAETVLIQVAARDGALEIEIEDDGRGFDPESVAGPSPSGRGLGLQGMRERVELLGGTVEIDAAPGHGTRIAVRVPLSVTAHA